MPRLWRQWQSFCISGGVGMTARTAHIPQLAMQRDTLCQYLDVTSARLTYLVNRRALPAPINIDGLDLWDRASVDEQDLGFVYFIQAAGSKRIKIGYSRNPSLRFADLQCACPDDLVMLAAVRSARDEETATHAKFRKFRVRGEWFEPAPELLAYIAEVATP